MQHHQSIGYLYIGAILLASARLSRKATLLITLIAVTLTLSNLWFPGSEGHSLSSIANRLIAVLALIATGFLGDRNRLYQDVLAKQQARLRSQEELAQLRQDFVSTLTHDLKTPLLGAIETLKALQRSEFGTITSAQSAVFDMMGRSHQTTLQMVEMLLDIYRNDAEGLILNLESINLTLLAEEVIATLRELASNRRIHLSLGYGASDFRRDLWVNGDRLQLQRVFANLITNSINHSPRGGKVEIWLESYPSDFLESVDSKPVGKLNKLYQNYRSSHSLLILN
jgi:two-component system NarL family sensor kinase